MCSLTNQILRLCTDLFQTEMCVGAVMAIAVQGRKITEVSFIAALYLPRDCVGESRSEIYGSCDDKFTNSPHDCSIDTVCSIYWSEAHLNVWNRKDSRFFSFDNLNYLLGRHWLHKPDIAMTAISVSPYFNWYGWTPINIQKFACGKFCSTNWSKNETYKGAKITRSRSRRQCHISYKNDPCF